MTLFPDTGSEGKNGDLYLDKRSGAVYHKDNGLWSKTDITRQSWDESQVGSKYRSGNGPPASAYAKWKEKAAMYHLSISDHIERIATNAGQEQGLDLADFLLRG